MQILNILKDIYKILKCYITKNEYGLLINPTYNEDGIVTWHLNSFMNDEKFLKAYKLGKATKSWGEDKDLYWRAYIACWAADHVKKLSGDFVECGVNKGGLARMIIDYIDFEKGNKRFFLLDTFKGIPSELITEEEKKYGVSVKHYGDVYEEVINRFKAFSNVEVIKGKVPDSLIKVESNKIVYLSLDMNVAGPEIAAAEYFWDKIVPGGIILIDDYGFSNKYTVSNRLYNEFAEKRNLKVLPLATGQGILVKPL